MASRHQLVPPAWPENSPQNYNSQYNTTYPDERGYVARDEGPLGHSKVHPTQMTLVDQAHLDGKVQYELPLSRDDNTQQYPRPLIDEHYETQELNCCWFVVPLFSFLSACLMSAGIFVWYKYVTPAYDNTVQAVEALGFEVDVSKEFKLSRLIIIIAESVIIAILFAFSYVRIFTVAKYVKKGVPNWRYSNWLTAASFFFYCLQHLFQFWFVVAMAVETAWLTLAVVGLVVSSNIDDVLGSKLSTIKATHDNLTGFVAEWDDFAAAVNGVLPVALSLISPYVSTIRNQIASGGVCPVFCLDLSSLPLMDSDMACLCDTSRFQPAADFFTEAWPDIGLSLLGLLLSYLGCTLISLNTIPSFVRSKDYL